MRTLTSLLLFAWVAFPQSEAKLEFEVASVKPAVTPARGAPGCKGGPGSDDPTRLTCESMSPGLMIVYGYGVKYLQVVGPDWLSTPRFDIVATLPPGTTKEQVPMMWQNLLASRFGCRAHHESREMTHFELSVSQNGPKLPLAGKKGVAGIGRRQDSIHLHFPKLTMEAFAGILGNQIRKVVTDATGIKGEYEITLIWTPDTAVPADGAVYPALPQALQEQLGLKLESKKGPMDMLVIDRINRTPTDN